jgi:hypothetical protein
MRTDRGIQLLVALAMLLAAFSASCNNSGNAGVYADLTWQVRCNVMRGCVAYPPRDILGFNNEHGHRILCSVVETADSRTLSFSAYARDYGIALFNARFSRAGGTPAGTGCVVSVQEDNTYEGACGGAPPTEAQPCQVTNVQFTRDAEGRSLVQGNIYCVNMSPRAVPNIHRELTAPGTDPSAASSPMTFRFFDCSGYQPD